MIKNMRNADGQKTVRIRQSLVDALNEEATKQDRMSGALVNVIVKDYLKKKGYEV